MKKKQTAVFFCLALAVMGILAGCGGRETEEPVVIAVESGTTTETNVREAYPDAKYIIVDDAIDGFLAVSSGKADAYASDKTIFDSYIASGKTGLAIYGDTTVGEPGNIAVAISPVTKIPDAAGKMNDFIREMSENGTLDDMRERWLVRHDYTMPEIPEAENPAFTVTVGTTGLTEPYSFYEGTALSGYDLELMRRFALWCNAELAVGIYDWDGILPACATGKVDYVMSNLFETPERREVVEFSVPYAYVETVLVVADEKGTAADGSIFEKAAESFEKTFLRENRWQLIWNGLLVTLE